MAENIAKPVSKDEIRNVSLKIFEKVLQVCDKLDINVWIMYGTLIGAVRHKGFISWDDDFDLIMKREDYDKFIAYCSKNRSALAPYYVDHFTVNPDYPFYIARICDPNYVLKFDNMDYTSGIFIDLYPFDGMGNNLDYWRSKKGSNKYTRKIQLITALIWIRNYKNPFIGSSLPRKTVHVLLGLYAKTRPNKHWMTKLDRIARTFTWNESSYVAPVGWDDRVRGLKREWFEGTTWLEFEDIRVPVPAKYKKILKEIYGNYMELPSKDKQVATHYYTAYRK